MIRTKPKNKKNSVNGLRQNFSVIRLPQTYLFLDRWGNVQLAISQHDAVSLLGHAAAGSQSGNGTRTSKEKGKREIKWRKVSLLAINIMSNQFE